MVSLVGDIRVIVASSADACLPSTTHVAASSTLRHRQRRESFPGRTIALLPPTAVTVVGGFLRSAPGVVTSRGPEYRMSGPGDSVRVTESAGAM